MDRKQRIEELVQILNEASAAYYSDKDEIMSNFEWDALFDELADLEFETGYILEDSPTQKTGYEENTESEDAKKEAHEYPALSLKKSKDISELQKWAGERPVWLSWKLDGLTLVATYDQGRLSKLMTRGNGTIGTNVTYLASYISGIPMTIPYQGHFVVRGEAVISYEDFNRINDMMEDLEETYANPRNLVSGTLALDKKRAGLVRERRVSFYAFTLVHTDEELVSWGQRMNLLQEMKFQVVDREETNAEKLPESIEKWTETVRSGKMPLPVDGLVIAYEDTEYAATGSVTGHHATNAGMAFKWQDTQAKTRLDHIEWSCAASMIAPVAVFDKVELEGTEVRRASLCNLSEMKRLGIGADKETELLVIKSNMIIPKCIKADAHGTEFTVPKVCPVCGEPTEIRISSKTGTETLHCTNEECVAKHLQKYTRFVSKAGMDLDGLSEKTLKRFINQGFIADFADIYDIGRYKDQIIEMDGFGQKSYENMLASISERTRVEPVHFIYALCIPMIGVDAGKKIIAACGTKGFFQRLEERKGFDDIDGIGPEKSNSILEWYGAEKNQKLLDKLLQRVHVIDMEPVEAKTGKCAGLIFVITGDVHHFKNRKEFTAYVEAQGGSVTSSVSKKTDYLVNNDKTSHSKKNQTAQKNNIPIITEDDFMQKFG